MTASRLFEHLHFDSGSLTLGEREESQRSRRVTDEHIMKSTLRHVASLAWKNRKEDVASVLKRGRKEEYKVDDSACPIRKQGALNVFLELKFIWASYDPSITG